MLHTKVTSCWYCTTSTLVTHSSYPTVIRVCVTERRGYNNIQVFLNNSRMQYTELAAVLLSSDSYCLNLQHADEF